MILLDDFDYALPDALIARYPLDKRSDSRLLHLNAQGQIADRRFFDLPSLLEAGDLLVLNNSKVIKARLFGKKESDGNVEVLVERVLDERLALCHTRASRSPKKEQKLILADGKLSAVVVDRRDNLFALRFDCPVLEALERFGQMPIPPYFDRQADRKDDERYQNVFCDPNQAASVAAPTAGLHFDRPLLQALAAKKIQTAFVTLHVGSGTFAPVKTQNVLDHKMHSEYAKVPAQTAELIRQTKARGNKVVAVGTTVARALESAFCRAGDKLAWEGETDIFIYPPYNFGAIDALITNFHLPKSTLLMLVSAFAGPQKIQQAYAHAIKNGYRFFSYGDSMLLEKPAAP